MSYFNVIKADALKKKPKGTPKPKPAQKTSVEAGLYLRMFSVGEGECVLVQFPE